MSILLNMLLTTIFLALAGGWFYLHWMLIAYLYMDMHWNNFDSIIDLPQCDDGTSVGGVFCFKGTAPIIYILTFSMICGLEIFIFKLIKNIVKGEPCPWWDYYWFPITCFVDMRDMCRNCWCVRSSAADIAAKDVLQEITSNRLYEIARCTAAGRLLQQQEITSNRF